MFKVLLGLGLLVQTAFAAPTLIVTDPDILSGMEKARLSLSEVLMGAESKSLDNKALTKSPFYKSLVDSLTDDLNQASQKDPFLGKTMKARHRQFDHAWLSSSGARYVLVGVVNRLDREPFQKGHCGEIRLIYRLSYEAKQKGSLVKSRLPLTINVVFFAKNESEVISCQKLAEKWSQSDLLSPEGPLTQLDLGHLKSIEVNLQAVRWPSTIRPDMGGYAEYFLRVFKPDSSGKKLVLSPMENTPDVGKLKSNPVLKAELLSWLKKPENLALVDKGVAVIPDKFLAAKATSVALHGMARLANRPFDQIYKASDFSDLDFSKQTFVKTPEAALVRLNDLSCVGCHQGRTVAGFHFLGEDPKDTPVVNAIVYSSSPHLVQDLPRRKVFMETLLSGKAPAESRALSLRGDSDQGILGSACGLGDPSFATWTCGKDMNCEKFDAAPSAVVGRCFPRHRRAGSSCEVGSVTQNADPTKDKIQSVKALGCRAGGVCEASSVGFPGGMCSGGCNDLSSEETCGSIALLAEFNHCLTTNTPFADCVSNNVRPAALRKCTAEIPCRDDYICAKISEGVGGCIPPYFLFQLRVDGHPKPPV